MHPFQTIMINCKSVMDKIPISKKLDRVFQELDGYFACAQYGEYNENQHVMSKTMNSEWQKVSNELVSRQYTDFIIHGTITSKAPTQAREYKVDQKLLKEAAAKKYIEMSIQYLKTLGIF